MTASFPGHRRVTSGSVYWKWCFFRLFWYGKYDFKSAVFAVVYENISIMNF